MLMPQVIIAPRPLSASASGLDDVARIAAHHGGAGLEPRQIGVGEDGGRRPERGRDGE
jgi:hypothetical protein